MDLEVRLAEPWVTMRKMFQATIDLLLVETITEVGSEGSRKVRSILGILNVT